MSLKEGEIRSKPHFIAGFICGLVGAIVLDEGTDL